MPERDWREAPKQTPQGEIYQLKKKLFPNNTSPEQVVLSMTVAGQFYSAMRERSKRDLHKSIPSALTIVSLTRFPI